LGQVLCVNEDVKRLRSGARISEKCLDLQQQRAKRQAGEAAPSADGKQARLPTCPMQKPGFIAFIALNLATERHRSAV